MPGSTMDDSVKPSEVVSRLQKHVDQISGLRHGLDDYFELEKKAEYLEKECPAAHRGALRWAPDDGRGRRQRQRHPSSRW
ncbi:hypothetical protein [Geomesophilobacter sediminis]|uniref:Uncharacterized protein n=1 Tax=Geomesophilobacter sediminis TaxID=2798584 RepID=A0A8J7JD96_9BACT|nr:hypothetical protein [Geomesophilobacter sediminis]MBJ6725033.1 hypothetical protein [Geomesophilobacter sediminis]